MGCRNIFVKSCVLHSADITERLFNLYTASYDSFYVAISPAAHSYSLMQAAKAEQCKSRRVQNSRSSRGSGSAAPMVSVHCVLYVDGDCRYLSASHQTSSSQDYSQISQGYGSHPVFFLLFFQCTSLLCSLYAIHTLSILSLCALYTISTSTFPTLISHVLQSAHASILENVIETTPDALASQGMSHVCVFYV